MWRVWAMMLPVAVCLGCGGGEPLARKEAPQDEQNQPAQSQPAEQVFLPEDGPTEEDHPDLHNLLQVSGTLYSGAEPKTEAAFGQLAELGVTVIVSVDGARPNHALAGKFGMRYIHIPIGYDGLDDEAVASFARAADDLKNEKTYVHCHHGKHRGPAGAAAICVATGQVDGTQALKVLEKAGTSKKYPGLWRDVQGYRRPSGKLPELVSEAKIADIPAAMARLDRASDNLKLCQEANWSVPKDHPDLVPGEEAQRMVEGLRATREHLTDDYDQPDFKTWLNESILAADAFEAAIRTGQLSDATRHFNAVQRGCTNCHMKYRNQ